MQYQHHAIIVYRSNMHSIYSTNLKIHRQALTLPCRYM